MEMENKTKGELLREELFYTKKNIFEVRTLEQLEEAREYAKGYAEYLDKAMELNIPNIIAHPDIYMLKRNDFGEIETKVAHLICQSAQKYNIPLEINLNNIFANTYYENRTLNNEPIEKQRPKLINVSYPCKAFWEIVSQYNVKVLYGLDAHHRTQISLWPTLLEFTKEILGEELLNKLDFIQE